MNLFQRWFIRRDLPEVLWIERAVQAAPWDEEDFLAGLRQRNCVGYVTEVGEQVVGYMLYELHERRLHLLTFAVHPAWHRQGVASAMLAKLQSKLSGHRRRYLTADVPEEALGMQLCLKRAGFEAVSVLKDRSAYRFVYCLPVRGRRDEEGVALRVED